MVVPYLQMNLSQLQRENRDSKRRKIVLINYKVKISTQENKISKNCEATIVNRSTGVNIVINSNLQNSSNSNA
jgi:hypothetical protein